MVHGILLGINPVSAAVFSEVSRTRHYARGLLEASLDALMVIDKDGALSDVNGALEGYSGRNREMMIGLPFPDLLLDLLDDQVDRRVQVAFAVLGEQVRPPDRQPNRAGEFFLRPARMAVFERYARIHSPMVEALQFVELGEHVLFDRFG